MIKTWINQDTIECNVYVYCTSLKNITIPNKFEEIFEDAFCGKILKVLNFLTKLNLLMILHLIIVKTAIMKKNTNLFIESKMFYGSINILFSILIPKTVKKLNNVNNL